MTDRADLPPEDRATWEAVLRSGIQSQSLVADCVAVGGTAAALYAGHRISQDVGNIVGSLRDHFDDTLVTLEQNQAWKTNRIQRPVLILGSLAGIAIGYRAPRRAQPIQVVKVSLPQGALVVPTLEEMICIKAFLAYQRNSLRDYLDFAALSELIPDGEVIAALMRLDDLYAGLQESSIRLEVAKSLSNPTPYDLDNVDLARYRALAPSWRDWSRTANRCRRIGLLLGARLLEES